MAEHVHPRDDRLLRLVSVEPIPRVSIRQIQGPVYNLPISEEALQLQSTMVRPPSETTADIGGPAIGGIV